MRTTIKNIKLSNFKGCKELDFNLRDMNEISGENGAGKTTIATAWFWLMSDKDYSLKSNPNIRPLDVEECTPRVEFTLDIGGQELKLTKYQKRIKKSENSFLLSNSYEINCVEYGERDFRNKLAEYGIDIDLFLPLSHLEVFTSQKANDMRKVLFSMTNKKTDFDIAKSLKNCKEVQELLETYTIEEIKAMQNATMKKIKENYGKSGEILRAKIEGLESAKVDVDVAEYELGKKAIEELIDNNRKKQIDVLEEYSEYEKMSNGILELNFKLNELQRKDKEKKDKKREEINKTISEIRNKIIEAENVIRSADGNITRYKASIIEIDKNIKDLKEQYNNAKKLKFDNRSYVCRYCGQEYPSERKTEIKAEFEEKRARELTEILEKNNELMSNRIDTKEKLNNEELIKKQMEKCSVKLCKQLECYAAKLDDVKELDITTTNEYKMIKEKETALRASNDIDKKLKELREDEMKLQSEMNEITLKIAETFNNDIIDEKIDKLLKEQVEFEQSKANCEKILYQLDLLNRKKNELLTDDINSNFELVDFKLFDYRKNGDYVECCIPRYKGKDLKVATNTGLEILMKLDIIKGLQKFYNLQLPVFIDCAESLSKESRTKINMDCQMTYLTVSEHEKLNINGSNN